MRHTSDHTDTAATTATALGAAADNRAPQGDETLDARHRRRAALHTLGCRLNQAETAALAAALRRRGFEIVSLPAASDVLILNSCSVTSDAEAECRRIVRSVLRRSPQTFVAVTGCYAQIGSKALSRMPGIDLIVGTEDKQRIPELLEDTTAKRAEARIVRSRPGKENFAQPEAGLYLHQTRANLKIQDGCDVGCSFCVIPQTRGRARSRQFDDVLREARTLLQRGHRELVITGVNLGSYRDGGRDIVDLLTALERLPGVLRLRISSIEPSTVTTELLQFMAQHPRLCRYLHIPVQSGCSDVLSRMRRPTSRADLDAVLAAVHRILPDATLGTDVMVGFPGEDEAAFARTRELVTNAGFSYLHIFPWSTRPGTRATRLPDPVPRPVAKQRSRELHGIDRRLRQRWAASAVGQEVEVLLEERKPEGHWVGLTDRFHRVAVPHQPSHAANTLVRVRVRRAQGRLLHGEPVPGDPVAAAATTQPGPACYHRDPEPLRPPEENT
jgi:threonylcarbamoyladenosine tRNA methylthiotransferase MtaB